MKNSNELKRHHGRRNHVYVLSMKDSGGKVK